MSTIREQLLQALAPREEKITLAGAELTVREIPESDDGEFFVDGKDALLKMIVRSTFDPDGKRTFTDADVEGLKSLGKVRLRRLSAAVMRVNGQALEEEVKNSAAVPSSG